MLKIRFLFLFILLYAGTAASAQEVVSLTRINDFGNNPGNLKMFVNDIGSDSVLKPLVIVLHGCGQSAEELAELTGWNKLASLNKFILVYPQQQFINNISTCFNWFRIADINKGQGECESIYQMILYIKQHYPVDSNRIFITGLSAGAAMAVVMMATHPELFIAGAVFAGGAYKLATNAFSSIGVMAGTKKSGRDALVNNVAAQNPGYKGKYPGLIIYQGLDDYVVNHKNAALLIEQWTGLQHCDNVADKTESSFLNIPDIRRMEFEDADGKTVLIYYEINNLGHRILIKPGNNNKEGGKTGTYGTDRGFHSTWQTAKDFGLINE